MNKTFLTIAKLKGELLLANAADGQEGCYHLYGDVYGHIRSHGYGVGGYGRAYSNVCGGVYGNGWFDWPYSDGYGDGEGGVGVGYEFHG